MWLSLRRVFHDPVAVYQNSRPCVPTKAAARQIAEAASKILGTNSLEDVKRSEISKHILFASAKAGEVGIWLFALQHWLPAPLVVDVRGRSLLMAAIDYDQWQMARILLTPLRNERTSYQDEYQELLLVADSAGRDPLMAVAQKEDRRSTEIFLRLFAECHYLGQGFCDLFRRTCPLIKRHLRLPLEIKLRQHWSHYYCLRFNDRSTIEECAARASELFPRPPASVASPGYGIQWAFLDAGPEWTEKEHWHLFYTLCNAAAEANMDLFNWLLHTWSAPMTQYPDIVQNLAGDLETCADHAACGLIWQQRPPNPSSQCSSRSFLNIFNLRRALDTRPSEQCMELCMIRKAVQSNAHTLDLSNLLLKFLFFTAGDNVFQTVVHFLFGHQITDVLEDFGRLARNHWDGKAISALKDRLEIIFNSKYSVYKHGMPLFGQVPWELGRLHDSDHQVRIQMLQSMLDRFHVAALPRLDLLIFFGRAEILQFLIDAGHVDLNAPINGGVAAETTCSMCEKNVSVTSPLCCGHHVCRLCLRALLLNNKEQATCNGYVRCSLCLTAVPASNYASVRTPLSLPCDASIITCHALKHLFPWFHGRLQRSMTLGSVLLMFAATVGSLRIVGTLIAAGVQAATKLKDGRTIMHVAAARGHFALVKWIGENGHLELANEVSLRGLRALHEALRSGATDVVRYLLSKGQMRTTDGKGRDWAFHAHRARRRRAQVLMVLQEEHAKSFDFATCLSTRVPLEEIKSVLQIRCFQESYNDEQPSFFAGIEDNDDEIPGFRMQDVVRHDRLDIMRWIFKSDGAHYGTKDNQIRQHTILRRWGWTSDRGLSLVHALRSRLQQHYSEWVDFFVADKKLRRMEMDGYRLCREVKGMFEAGEAVAAIEQRWNEVQALQLPETHSYFTQVKHGAAAWLAETAYGNREITCKTALGIAVENNYVPLVGWLLDRHYSNNLEKGLTALETAINYHQLTTATFVFAWLVEKQVDTTKLSLLQHATGAWDHRKCRGWSILVWLVHEPGISNCLSDAEGCIRGPPDPSHGKCGLYWHLRERWPEDDALKFVQLLASRNYDFTENVASHGKCRSMIQHLINVRQMKAVSWLARVAGISVEDLRARIRRGSDAHAEAERLLRELQQELYSSSSGASRQAAGGEEKRPEKRPRLADRAR
jgi:hypothetical protein